jgi:tetratricopeptide (TPR) repeat protein
MEVIYNMSNPKANNADEYIAQQRAAIASNPECGTSHYNLGVALMGKKEYIEAEKEFIAAIDCSPGLAEAYVQMGGICLQQGDLEGCLDWNKRATKARPGFSEGWANVGYVHLQRGEVDEAIKAFERATYFNFRFVQAFASLATAYLMKGDVDKSIECSQKALEVEPNFAVAHNNLGIALLEKGEKENAKKHILKAQALGYAVAPQILQGIGE